MGIIGRVKFDYKFPGFKDNFCTISFENLSDTLLLSILLSRLRLKTKFQRKLIL